VADPQVGPTGSEISSGNQYGVVSRRGVPGGMIREKALALNAPRAAGRKEFFGPWARLC